MATTKKELKTTSGKDIKTVKPYFDKTAYVFEYPVKDVLEAVNEKLDSENLNDYNLNMFGFLLTELNEYASNGIDTIMLNSQESAATGLYNKRSVAAKKAAETRKTKGATKK